MGGNTTRGSRWTESFCVTRECWESSTENYWGYGEGWREATQVGGVKHAGGKFRVKFSVKLLTEAWASTNHNAPWIRTAEIRREFPGSCRPHAVWLLLSLALSPSIRSLFRFSSFLLLLFSSLTSWRTFDLPTSPKWLVSALVSVYAFVHSGIHVFGLNPSWIIRRKIVRFTSHFQQQTIYFIALHFGELFEYVYII